MFKEYTEAHFKTLHECDRRIEGKIDELAKTLQDKQEKKQEARISLRHKIIIAFVSSIMGIGGAIATHFAIGG
jgi:hypothetical protein